MRGGWANISKNRLIFGAIVALTFCTVSIGYGLLEAAKYEQQANDKIGEYTKYTRDKVTQACVGVAKIDKIKCVNESFEAKREYEYNQSDLVAQRQSALWAYIMAAAAVFGIALSAGGMVLVYTTFREARKSNEIAQQIGQAQTRCYLSVKSAKILIEMSGNIGMTIILLNSGQSPARNFRWSFLVNLRSKNPNFNGEIGLSKESLISSGHSCDIAVGESHPPNQILCPRFELLDIPDTGLPTYMTIGVKISLFWDDIFGKSFNEDWNFQYSGARGFDKDIALSPDVMAVNRSKLNGV